GPEPSEDAGEEAPVALAAECAVERLRRPELGAGREDEAGGHDADDGPRHVVDANDTTQHARVGAEVAAPEAIAQNDDVRRVDVARVVRGERTAERGGDAQEMEVARRDAEAVDTL